MNKDIDKLNDKIDKIVKDVELDNKKEEELEKQIKEEFENYKKEFMKDDIKLYDKKPFIQKLIFIIVGLSLFPVGFALYFLTYQNKNYKWQPKYLLKSSTIGLALTIIATIFEIITNIIESLI